MEIKKGRLPVGVRLSPLKTHIDDRGCFTELFRQSWITSMNFIQWNAVSSKPGTLRGLHVHIHHSDYLTVLQGTMSIGLYDLRQNSPTFGEGSLIELNEDNLATILIPRGVAHGFYANTACLSVYSVTHYWDTADELACHWNDPDLQIPWPGVPTQVSERDKTAPSLAVLKDQLKPSQSFFAELCVAEATESIFT